MSSAASVFAAASKSAKEYLLASTPFLPPLLRYKLVPAANTWTRHDDKGVARVDGGDIRLLIGPLNTAGQGLFWSRAAAELPGVSAASLGASRHGEKTFKAHASPSLNAVRHSPTWSRRQSNAILRDDGFTHVIIESAQPIMGKRYARDLSGELAAMHNGGVKTALVWHGSDIRDPKRHRDAHPDSPFHGALDGLTERLEETTRENNALADWLGAIEFVSTPDLLDYRPNAIWLPTLYDRELWSTRNSAKNPGKPTVVHIPSRAALKGTAAIRKEMRKLSDTVQYRELSGLTPAQVRDEVRRADIVIDQVGMGVYGVASIEAMAVGKPVVAELGDSVRSRIGEDVPIVEATAVTIADVVRDLAANSDRRDELALVGVDYVQRIHSQQNIANVLNESFLSLS